ncbi:hypothetical protein SVIOM74S_02044 [Streptomyces violarus]
MASPLLSLTWTDHVTGRQGFLVVDRLVRGVASGGLRMRPGCTLDEVTGLARGMTMKEALHYDPDSRYVPLGGAKGGIDCDPRDPEAYPLLVRYLRAMRPHIESFWTTGEDLGLSQDLVDRAAAEAGLVSSIQAVYPLLEDEGEARRRLGDAFAVEVDGIGLDELVGGCGVAEAALTALDRAGVPHAGTRVALQGLGTMGGATARFLSRAGLTVVAVADIKGTIANPAGLDIEALLAARDLHGTVRPFRAAPRRPRTAGRRLAVGRHGRPGARRRLVRDRRREPGPDHRPLGRRGGQHARTAGGGTAIGRTRGDRAAGRRGQLGDERLVVVDAVRGHRRRRRGGVRAHTPLDAVPGRADAGPRTGRRHDTAGRRPRARGGPAAGHSGTLRLVPLTDGEALAGTLPDRPNTHVKRVHARV